MNNSSVVQPVDLDFPVEPLTVSFLSYNHKFFRLYNSVRARIDALKFQNSLYLKYPKNYPVSGDRSILFDPYLTTLEAIKSDIIRVHYISVNCNTVRDDSFLEDSYKMLNKRFKSLPSTIEDHSLLIWGKYIPKKSTLDRQLNIKRNFVNRLIKKGLATKKQISDLKDEEFKHSLRKTYMKKVRTECLQARKFDLQKRLEHEIITRNQDNWFMIFNTLTVAPEYINDVFTVKSKVWTNYIRSIDRAIGIVSEGSWRKAVSARLNGREFHTYFACVEHGSRTGHLHIHVLHMCKKLPLNAYDPNRGAIRPNKMEIDFFRPYWKYGFSAPRAVRFGQSDAYGVLGWRYPVEAVGNKWLPIPIRSPMGICQYMSKYMSKSVESPLPKGLITWRVRLSRNLGKNPTKELCEILPTETLKQILKIPNLTKVKMFNRSINQRLLRQMAFRELMKRLTPMKSSMILMETFNLEPRESSLKKLNSVLECRAIFTNVKDTLSKVQSIKDMVDFNIDIYIKQIESNYKNIQTFFKARGMSEEVYI